MKHTIFAFMFLIVVGCNKSENPTGSTTSQRPETCPFTVQSSNPALIITDTIHHYGYLQVTNVIKNASSYTLDSMAYRMYVPEAYVQTSRGMMSPGDSFAIVGIAYFEFAWKISGKWYNNYSYFD